MRKFFILFSFFFIGSCACDSIPKAGPVANQNKTRSAQSVIPSSSIEPPHHLKLELPAITNSDNLVSHIGYTASYNHDRLIPNWVAYELTRVELMGNIKGEESFQWDPDIKGRQAWREDYSGSGWDKGHMVPRADLKWSEKAYSESFYFTNICPQDHEFNAGSWLATEKMARRIARQYGSVYVICGPLVFDNLYGSIGNHKVTVPDAFFKAFLIFDGEEYSAIGIIMKNSPERQMLKSCTLTIDELEIKCGLDLFHGLKSTIQDNIEARIDWRKWGI